MYKKCRKALVLKAKSGTYQHRFVGKVITVKPIGNTPCKCRQKFEQPYRKGNAGFALNYNRNQLKFINKRKPKNEP